LPNAYRVYAIFQRCEGSSALGYPSRLVILNVVHLEFLVVHREFHKSFIKRPESCNLHCTINYVRCQHSEVVRRIFFKKMVHGPENGWEPLV